MLMSAIGKNYTSAERYSILVSHFYTLHFSTNDENSQFRRAADKSDP